MKILVGSTIPAFAMTADDPTWHHWLENAEAISATAVAAGHEVHWIAVLQTDARGAEIFNPLILDRFDEMIAADLEPTWWGFALDTVDAKIDSGNRLAGICIGRNLIIECAIRHGHDAIYFADSDISAPEDILPRLLELDWPVCGAHVPTYCLDGPQADSASYMDYPNAPRMRRAGRKGDVRVHWNTAGSLLVHRDVFRRVPWRHDPDAGCTDDPATQGEMARIGWHTLVRHDVECTHHPDAIGGLEGRGLDLAVYR